MWSLGDSQRSQKTRLEERAVSHLITSMDDLYLNHAYNSANSTHNSSDHLIEVLLTHIHREREPRVCHLSVVAHCVCVVLQSVAVEIRPDLTQGDKLRALKSRRPPRLPAAVRYWDENKVGVTFCVRMCKSATLTVCCVSGRMR